jgi:hypothetical protein
LATKYFEEPHFIIVAISKASTNSQFSWKHQMREPWVYYDGLLAFALGTKGNARKDIVF